MNRPSLKYLFPGIAGAVFLMTAIAIVVSSWAAGLHVYDLSLSFSGYAGLRQSTAVLYFLSAVIMLVLLSVYIAKTKMPGIKKAIYILIFLSVLGTALFPCNRERSVLSSDIHDIFAMSLMFTTALSFVLTAILSKSKIQRVSGIAFAIYAAGFIAALLGKNRILDQTFFVWEVVFIYLLILELYLEKYGETRSNKKPI